MFQKTLAFRIFFIFSLILIGCFVFLPLLWMINTALKPADKTFTLYFFAGELTLENIIGILTDKTIMTYLKNSLIVSFLSSFMATLVSSFAAYSFSKFRYRGRKAIMGAFMMSQAFPQAILLLAIYLMMQRFHLDKPVGEQFLIYLGNLAHGDFGMVSRFFYLRKRKRPLLKRI